jgi:F-type H+-transporting ATPase subunit delta
MYREKKNILEVKGVVAKEMSQSQLDSLKTSLDKILGKQTELSMEVDSTLIGGIKLRIENTFLDASIQNQLQILRAELLQI